MELPVRQTTAQLRYPYGEAGIVFKQAINLCNLTQIIDTFAAVHLQNSDNILETGYNNGDLLSYILSQADGLHYTGLEISPLMHEQARAFDVPFIAAEQVNYRLYNDDALPFADIALHKAMSVGTVYFWDNAPFMLAGLCRVLKSGGRLCLNFYKKDFMARLPFTARGFILYDVADIRALAENLPLRCISEQHNRDQAISKSGKLVRQESVSLVFECA